MSTPLVVLACILAFFALILIPLMMMKGERQRDRDRHHPPVTPGRKPHKKKKKR